MARVFFDKLVANRVRLNQEVQRITRTKDGWWVCTSQEKRFYDKLVSTIPIHELVRLWDGIDLAAYEPCLGLKYNSLVNVLLGFSKAPIQARHSMTALYVPAPEIVFHRLSFPKAFSEQNVPTDAYAIMAEITLRSDDPTNKFPHEWLDTVLEDLVTMGMLGASDKPAYSHTKHFKYGYPVYDLNYSKNISRLRDILELSGIELLGRFGEFQYINSDVCVEHALKLAEKLNHE
jgi:protoporphyrinogen oxidase